MIPARRVSRIAFALAATFMLLPGAGSASPNASRTWDGSAIASRSQGLPFEPIFHEIQVNIFTPNCTLSFCHGAAMQANMDLRDGAAYDNIVGVASIEVPDKMRIAPFQPDESYMICKLENCPWIVGSQMPLIGGPLSQDVIDVMRAWVSLGALEFPAISVEENSWGRVKALYKD